jgi:hypothetical protein
VYKVGWPNMLGCRQTCKLRNTRWKANQDSFRHEPTVLLGSGTRPLVGIDQTRSGRGIDVLLTRIGHLEIYQPVDGMPVKTAN